MTNICFLGMNQAMYYVLCIMYYVLCIMYYVLCIMYYVLCIIYYVLCTQFEQKIIHVSGILKGSLECYCGDTPNVGRC